VLSQVRSPFTSCRDQSVTSMKKRMVVYFKRCRVFMPSNKKAA
jgi:hypothetical protein